MDGDRRIRIERWLRNTTIDVVTEEVPNSLADDLVLFIQGEVAAGTDVQVKTDTDLVMSGLVDSQGVVLIVELLERRLGIRIDPADVVIEHFESVAAILDYLDRRDDCDVAAAD